MELALAVEWWTTFGTWGVYNSGSKLHALRIQPEERAQTVTPEPGLQSAATFKSLMFSGFSATALAESIAAD